MRYVRLALPWIFVIGVVYLGYRFIWPLFLPEELETDIQTQVVARGDLRRVVPADGVLRPAVLVEVKSKASGVVELINVEPGDMIETGAVIVELDKERLLARKRQAEASLTSARAQLKKVMRDVSPAGLAASESSLRQAQITYDNALIRYERVAELHAKAYATDEEFDEAKRTLDSADESLKQSRLQLGLNREGDSDDVDVATATVAIRQAELDDVMEELSNTIIRSPINGKVLTRPVELGTAVASGTSGATGGTVVATVGDLSTLFVEALLDETDLGRVEPGMSCRVTFDAFTGYVWNGNLKKIYPQGRQDQGSGTRFPVDIELDLVPVLEGAGPDAGGGRSGGGYGGGSHGGGRPGAGGHGGGAGSKPEPVAEETAAVAPAEAAEVKLPEIRPNMTANVEFVLEDHPQVLILQARLLQYDDEQKPYVEVLPDPEDQDQRERRDVELGFTDGMRYEVVSGIEEGETVIIEREIAQD